jgi:hypothetical protein
MSTQALQIIKTKHKSIEFFLKLNPNEKLDMNKEKLNDIETEISMNVECTVENNPHFKKLSDMLFNMDSVCYSALKTFQTLLPEMEARTYVQRQKILINILKKYSIWLKMDEPRLLQNIRNLNNNEISGCLDSDVVRREGIESITLVSMRYFGRGVCTYMSTYVYTYIYLSIPFKRDDVYLSHVYIISRFNKVYIYTHVYGYVIIRCLIITLIYLHIHI